MCSRFSSELTSLGISYSDCSTTLNSALMTTPLQAISLFMKDALQVSIRFLSYESLDSAALEAELNDVELFDAHTFMLAGGLRPFYNDFIQEVLRSQVASIGITVLFGVFVSVLIVLSFVVRVSVMWRIRKWYWNTLFLLQLLPRDDMDMEYIRSINEMLRKS